MKSTISRVEKEFIFNFLIKNNVEVEIKSDKNATEGIFLEQSSKEIKIELKEVFEEMKDWEAEIRVFFYFQTANHTFNSNILKIQGKTIIVRNPESIVRNLLRKYERILINGKLDVQFVLLGKILPLNYPKSKNYYISEKPPISADFSEVKIDSLLNKFNDRMSSIVSINKITMLRNYTPKTFFEGIVLEYGKILYINDTHTNITMKQINQNFTIIERNDWIDFEMSYNHTNPGMVNRVISDYLKTLADSNILSYVIVPILYREYVVGLISLINDHQKNKIIDEKVVNYTFQFSQIMSYALKQSGYFKDEEGEKDRYKIPIFDMSPGGIAFFINDDSFEEKLQLDKNFQFEIKIENRIIPISTKLVRKYQKMSQYFYGFMFLSIKTDDFNFLNTYLYGS